MDLWGYDLAVGFDTEYVSESRASHEGETLDMDHEKSIAKGNRVLCISYAVLIPSTGQRVSGSVDIPAGRARRWTMKQFLEQVLDALEVQGLISGDLIRAADERRKKRNRRNIRIMLVGHFTRADLPGFADFRRLKRKFSAVRKTYVSIERPHVFSVRPGRHRSATVSVTMRDTRLLAPAGYGSLAAIGNMLGFEKLSVPDVTDETGNIVQGITRMDLVQGRHPAEFREYAKRDAEIVVNYIAKFAELAEEIGVSDVPATIGALAIKLFKTRATDFDWFMGRSEQIDLETGRKKLELMPVIREHAGIWANGYRGGRNQCFAHGIFDAPEGRVWSDLDLSGAYTSAMALLPPIDWNSLTMPSSVDGVATMDAATVARVRFEFPAGTRFPCLPVPAGNGLLFPLAGETTTTGVELLAARNMGCRITILTALRFEFMDGEHEYASFTKVIAAYRAKFKKSNPLFEKLAKEAGNSLYGKTAQAVAGMRSVDPDKTRHFDTIKGERMELPPSAVTNPVHAAMTTAFVRSVLAEILSALPADRAVLSVTTDGFLTDASIEEAMACCTGPITRRFAEALDATNPGKPVLEVKHTARTVAVARTRGAFTVNPADEEEAGAPIMSRAGHKLEGFDGTAWEQTREFVQMFLGRTPNMTLKGRDFISVQDQWMADADLIALPVSRRINLDYDLSCVPVNVAEVQGVLNFTTVPWSNVQSYLAGRKALARLRFAGGHLKTLSDWQKIEEDVQLAAGWQPSTESDDVLQWLRSFAALHLAGDGKAMTLAEAAAAITSLGLPTTADQINDAGKKARLRGLPKPPSQMARKLERFVPNTKSEHGAKVLAEAKTLISGPETCPKCDGAKVYKGEHVGTLPLAPSENTPSDAPELTPSDAVQITPVTPTMATGITTLQPVTATPTETPANACLEP